MRAFSGRHVAKVFYALAGLIVVACVLYLTAVFMNAMKFRGQVPSAEHMAVGDTSATVLQILGEPRMRIEKGGQRFFGSPYERETWAYDW